MWTRLTFECDGMQARLPHSACRSPGRGEGWGVTPCETSASEWRVSYILDTTTRGAKHKRKTIVGNVTRTPGSAVTLWGQRQRLPHCSQLLHWPWPRRLSATAPSE